MNFKTTSHLGCVLTNDHLVTSSTHSAPLAAREISSIPLRILPLGDSITWGYINGQGTNGYREQLGKCLTSAGSTVDFVGTVTSGNMTDNQNEGHSGWTINAVRAILPPALDFKPNVVLVHLATNDLNRAQTSAEPWSGAPERLGGVIDDILAELPNAVVFVAKIIQTRIVASQARFNTYNDAIPGVVKARTDKGYNVVVVDQSIIGTGELDDDLHP